MEQLLVGDVITTAAQRTPGRMAATLGDRRMTFADVAETAEHLAGVLLARGVGHGDRVAWWAETSLDAVPLFHMAGWASTLNTWLGGDEMVYVVRPDADNLLDAVERHRAHMMYCIPAVWRRILDADRTGRDLSSLARADTGTSATTPELLA